MRTLCLAAAAIVLAATAGLGNVQAAESKRVISGDPPHPSTTGIAHRSKTATKKGANVKGFCPPGQDKKVGKGSAFRC